MTESFRLNALPDAVGVRGAAYGGAEGALRHGGAGCYCARACKLRRVERRARVAGRPTPRGIGSLAEPGRIDRSFV